MKRIKIAQIITRMDWGGSPDILRLICADLDKDLFDFRLITGPTLHPSSKTREFLAAYKDKTITIPELQRNCHPAKDVKALVKLTAFLKKEKFDIVHTHTAKAGALGRIAAWFSGGAKIVHTSHGHNFYGYFGPAKSRVIVAAEKLLAGFTDRITALTELERQDLFSYGVARPGNVAVINSGIDLGCYRDVQTDTSGIKKALNVPPNSVLVGFIGRLEPIKDPVSFVGAASLIVKKFSEAAFLIVGEGSLRPMLEARCRELRISQKVTLAGWREDVPEILSVLDVIVLPSLNEAVGRILIEAGAAGKPAVASHVGGIPEIIRDGETGILVPPQDAASLARAISSLLENPERRTAMGEAAKKWIDDKFSALRMAEQFAHLYRELAGAGQRNSTGITKVPDGSVDNIPI
ncbi:MAG: glycosyltransferase family 4 protein [Nitrospiraceae bacterium]|nr:MAG: glycosyltransferase family 4 protein [Nitrospiraceae bacterium]